ncbi:hypothetical protein Q5P01_004324 [Channa striata]|uniref:Secreted protein n=1 Tax=Channa striata TaxID=64152 RepID=A0AA88NIM7_CHASR|nr:hypothetical protein Q5P01_004324 [Channa striata]
MRRPTLLALVLFFMVGMVTEWHIMAQAARHHGCCTAFSNVHVKRLVSSTRGRRVACWWQGITEHCRVNAV